MPLIAIQSLPFAEEQNISLVLEQISKQFSEANNIKQSTISVTWGFFDPGHYCHNGIVGNFFEDSKLPMQIEILAADVFSDEQIAGVLNSLAKVINQVTQIPLDLLFITYRRISSGMVFDNGKVLHWRKND